MLETSRTFCNAQEITNIIYFLSFNVENFKNHFNYSPFFCVNPQHKHSKVKNIQSFFYKLGVIRF